MVVGMSDGGREKGVEWSVWSYRTVRGDAQPQDRRGDAKLTVHGVKAVDRYARRGRSAVDDGMGRMVVGRTEVHVR